MPSDFTRMLCLHNIYHPSMVAMAAMMAVVVVATVVVAMVVVFMAVAVAAMANTVRLIQQLPCCSLHGIHGEKSHQEESKEELCRHGDSLTSKRMPRKLKDSGWP
ncbi:unnamed protein product [Victoria cruziana]